MHFQKRRCAPVPGSASDSSIEKKLTVCKVHKQSTKRGMQSQDRKSLRRLYISVSQLSYSPSRGDERHGEDEAWRLVCVRGSAERVVPQWNHRTDV